MKPIVGFIGLAILFFVSCHDESHHTKELVNYKVAIPILKDTIINKEYVCQIHAYQHIELRALEKGYLHKILVDEGQFVKKGELLFKIQPAIYEAETKRAQSELEFAQVEYDNTKALADKNIVSQSDQALAKAKLEKAKAELTIARTHLNFTEIRAPFDGIVGKFEDVRFGSLLDEGELLTTLSDNSKMWVYFNVPEAEYLDYFMQKEDSLNNRVYLKLVNQKIFPEDGVIETIESDFNSTTGNIAFRATFANPNKLLRHRQTGSILWPKDLENVIMIPQKATFEVLEKKFAFVVNDKGIVASKELKIVGELDHIYFIDGLEPSDQFLIEGLRKVQNGDTIHTEKISSNEMLESLHLHAE